MSQAERPCSTNPCARALVSWILGRIFPDLDILSALLCYSSSLEGKEHSEMLSNPLTCAAKFNKVYNTEKTPVPSMHRRDISVLVTGISLTLCSHSLYCLTRQPYTRIGEDVLAVYSVHDCFPMKQILRCLLPHFLAMYPISRVSTSVLLANCSPCCEHICFGATRCKLVCILQSILWKNGATFFFSLLFQEALKRLTKHVHVAIKKKKIEKQSLIMGQDTVELI